MHLDLFFRALIEIAKKNFSQLFFEVKISLINHKKLEYDLKKTCQLFTGQLVANLLMIEIDIKNKTQILH